MAGCQQPGSIGCYSFSSNWKQQILHCFYQFAELKVRGAFNKFQDYVLNTTTVNRTCLTVMLSFNIFFLQFTAMFPLFYKSAGTHSIRFFLCTCRNFCTKCCRTFSAFSNLMSPSDSLCGLNKWKLLGAKSGLNGKCCSSSQHIFSIFLTV